MYITTAYLYQQIQPVLLIDISGAFFDARWDPVYAKNLTLNLGVDNVILFQFQNQDQKPVNISGATFTFRIISQNGQDLLFAKELVALNSATGRAKVTITAEDTKHLQEQPASYSLEISSGVLDQAVFTDSQAGARGTIDIMNSVFPAFTASEMLTIPTGQPSNHVPNVATFYSSTLTTDGSSLTTFQLDTTDYSGNLQAQGASDATAYTVEWYNVDLQDLQTGNTVGNLTFDHSIKRIAFNVEGYHPYIRLQFNALTNVANVGDGLHVSSITYR
jgi:hypothetical protein